VIPPERVQGAVHDEANELFSGGYAVGRRLAHCNPGTDIHVAHRKRARLAKLKGKDVSRTIETPVLGIEPAHCLTSYEGDGDERLATLASEHRSDDSADRRR
jgi:hypothetical protein